MPLTLKSPAFRAGGNIPRKYTCDGENISPPFEWSGIPVWRVNLGETGGGDLDGMRRPIAGS
jgi:hypothetical protein